MGGPLAPPKPPAVPEKPRESRGSAELEGQLEALKGLNQSLYQDHSIKELVDRALDQALVVVEAEASSLLLVSPECKKLKFFHSKGPSPVPNGTQIPWNKGIAGYVFHSGKSEISQNPKEDSRHLDAIDTLTGFKTRNLIALPIKRLDGEVIGVMEVLNMKWGANDEERRFLELLSSLLSISIHKAWLVTDSHMGEIAHFAGDCAHDMKNMLMTILMGTELLRDDLQEVFAHIPNKEANPKDPSFQTCNEVLDLIRKNAHCIQKNSKELVDCVMGHSSALQFAPCDVATVATNAIETLSFLSKENGITVRTEGLTSLPSILANERKLFSVFYNLINNAIPETQVGGTITVRGHTEADAVHLSVTDTGRGMSKQVQENLFSDHITSSKTMGNAYGMKSIKNAIEAHGGSLKIQSTVGIGTTIHFSIPIEGLTSRSGEKEGGETPGKPGRC